ncbi:hypothetical protein JKF63_07820 [Porcisia hertigi]|uniref:Uncharacterized protein n=1 Tax=Porcisia hertigi TaxID=2761500 RepID=A0A837A9D1_9TRYP|nr:hypothetical protein JKF63_07820 [Porcisia hertigi]
MERPPWPEPTRLSPYFFQQVVSRVPPADAPPGDVTKDPVGDNPPPQGHASLLTDAMPEGCTATKKTSPPSSSPGPASAYALGVNAGVLEFCAGASAAATARPDAGAPVRVTSDAATDAALWKCFTPSSFREGFEEFIKAESAQTESLRRCVTAAWRDVEHIQERNTLRRATLKGFLADPGAAWREQVRKKLFWQMADIVQRYGFEVDMDDKDKDGGAEARLADSERVTLDFTLDCDVANEDQDTNPHSRGAKALSGSSSEDEGDRVDTSVSGLPLSSHQPQQDEVTATTEPHAAKASAKSSKELLNPCNRRHFLRRMFAPLQRMRESLPKWTALLLHDILNLQKSVFPSLEKRVQDSVYFKVPLHRPFLTAQAALQLCVQQKRVAPDTEVVQVPVYRQLEQQGQLWSDFVQAHESFAATVVAAAESEKKLCAGIPAPTVPSAEDEITHTTQRWATAEALWTLLFDELDRCKSFFGDAIASRNAVREGATAEMSAVQESVRTHRSHGETTMAVMRSEAEACAEMLSRNSQRTLTAVEEMESTFTSERNRLQQSIARGEARLTQLEEQQEKSARRVREALKAFFMEQLQYEETSQALLQDHLSLTQLETSHNQLRRTVEQRRVDAVGCKRETVALQQLLNDGDTAVQQIFDACEAHCRRMETDNHFIQCRLVDQCTLALQQRCRCLHAIAALYEQRYAILEARTGDAWQLQFLLSSERDWAVANLSDARAEVIQLEHDWIKVRAMRNELELPPAKLDPHVVTPEWQKLMATLLNLDAPPSLQRRLPTLRTHAATMARPVAGCGQQAVRHLLSDTATAQASLSSAP